MICNRRALPARRALVLAASTLVIALSACAPRPAPLPTPTPAPGPAPVVVIPPRPVVPGNAAETQQLPPLDSTGRYITLNSGATGERAFWHVRVALNVAAIGCRGERELEMIDAYNRFVRAHNRTMTAAERKVIADLRTETRTNGIAARDALSTSLFNYFAQPPAQREFCAVAVDLAQQAASAPASELIPSSRDWLDRLDKPFTDFYAAFAKYKVDAAAWDAAYAPPPAPVPVASQPPYGPTGG